MKVSVIIPVYGVEKFVGKCIESLLNQTWNDLEVIVVNDNTFDKSIDIVEHTIAESRERKLDVKIITHDKNRGLPAARNTGMLYASGDYILHIDGDDFIECDMIEKMVTFAEEGDYDIVYSDWYLSYDSVDRYMFQPVVNDPKEALSFILKGKMKYNVWNKLVKKSLYQDHKIRFPEGYGMGEDMTMIKLFAVADKVGYIPKAFYHYVKTNMDAMTENITVERLFQIDYNVKSVEKFLIERGAYDERLFSLFKLSVKYPLLFGYDSKNYKYWRKWFVETMPYESDRNWSYRTRLLHLMAHHDLFIGLKMHFLIHSFLYKIKYKLK